MTISSSAQKIVDAAVLHFAEKGFDAGSLNTIAEGVGIRKATIYSHFKNKEELFLQAFTEAVEKEGAFVDECFSRDECSGETYLTNVSGRYQDSARLRFLLRTAFIPPEELRGTVQEGYGEFLNKVRAHFVSGLSPEVSLRETLWANAYLGIVDSVHVELLYASATAAEARREALWFIFHASLNRTERG
ncbi:TetR/AcrR family transcriptional regulator [Erwinia sp. S43]|uniref:TetR/AcrR family transcriptional regulator n=1 Tax=Erwinia sp. S43 TaxID=2769339 RepID=UPI00190E089F|nr:TetR/AcrR family transcriptional regulator [Erwinia sp. S43]MBK0035776.1 TetR/AcrR family transcriptional regulator [Erwinia sp. S43]